MSIQRLSEKGYCMAMHVSYPRLMGSLDPKIFNLLIQNEADRELVKGPRTKRLGKALLDVQRMERKARDTIRLLTFDLGKSVGLRFCPLATLPELYAALETLRTDFMEAARTFIDEFPNHAEKARHDWREFADKQTRLDQSARDALYASLMEQLPTRAPTIDQFSMFWVFAELAIPGQPELTTMEGAQAATIAEVCGKIQQDSKANMDSLLQSFEGTCRSELRTRMLEFFQELGKTVQEGKTVNSRTLRKINDFLASLRQLDFSNDTLVTDLSDKLRKACFPQGMPPVIEAVSDDEMIRDIRSAIDESMAQLKIEALYSSNLSEAVVLPDVMSQTSTEIPDSLII